jgi:hypothetical protein
VIHIRESTSSEHHKLNNPARLVDGELSYEPESALQLGLDIG